jgi:osmotically-inducible protein OsmY
LSAPPVAGDDRSIREAFHQTLREQPWGIGAGAVNALVTDGVVHLWGVAPDEAQRQAIVVAAEAIPGVRGVEDHMDHKRAYDPMDRPNWPSPARP